MDKLKRPFPTKRVLGIDFFDGTAEEAVAWASQNGGLIVAPAAPSMIALQTDLDFREAITQGDLAIADSGWMVLFWRILRGEKLTRISGLKFFRCLLDLPEAHLPGNLFWVLPSENAKQKTLAWSRAEQFSLTSEDLYVAPRYCSRFPVGSAGERDAEERGPHGGVPAAHAEEGVRREHDSGILPGEVRGSQSRGYSIEDPVLLAIIRQRRPKHIVIAIGGGMQDKIGNYLKQNCGYHPGIYCIGAAPGFVTGDQVRIPMWADRFYLGWIFRVFAQPRTLAPRFWGVRKLPRLILRYGRELPPAL